MRISPVKHALLALAVSAAAFVGGAHADPIRGAGSTFAAPVIGRWAQAYQATRTDGGDYVSQDWTVDYEPIGSLAGFMRLSQPEMDFAATDAPLPSAELKKRGLAQFPIVIGGIVPVINVEGVAPGTLKMTGPLLAEIFLGKVKNWSDPALREINPGLSLPDQPITVVHRADGSGSTANWTSYLSAHSAEWKNSVGSDTLVKWPAGVGAEGSSGVLRKVQETRGAIAYVEFGQVARAALSYALVQNASGAFIAPSRSSFQAAAVGADWQRSADFAVSLLDTPAAEAHPLTIVTFALVPAEPASPSRARRTLEFFRLALEKGGEDAAALGYVPLPDAVVRDVETYWKERIHGVGGF